MNIEERKIMDTILPIIYDSPDKYGHEIYEDLTLCEMMMELLSRFKIFINEDPEKVNLVMNFLERSIVSEDEEIKNTIAICFIDGLVNSYLWDPVIGEKFIDIMGSNTRKVWERIIES